ncbi:MAG: VCBS repeat-containing protein, partial [Candidatus Sumerlaeia bacterium]|nr:VCBS repeat-containing protein [Candidatus Sumerlaeia bacterium]
MTAREETSTEARRRRHAAAWPFTLLVLALAASAPGQPQFTQVLHGVLDGRSEFIWNGGQKYVYPAFGDVDADGDLDLFLGNFGDVSFFRNDGTPRSPRWTFVNRNHLGLDPDDHWPAPAMCDIDADGFEDLFVATWNSELLYYSASPTGLTLVTRNFIPDIGGSARLIIYPEFGDLDGDGDFDLLIGVSQREGPAPEPGLSGTVLYYRNDGTPQAPAMTALGNALGLSVSPEFVVTPELLDLDGDGDLDALLGTGDVWNRTQYRFVRFENVGPITTPSFVSQETGFLASHVRPDVPGLNAEAVDLDSDSRTELVIADEWALHTVLRLPSTASPEWEPDVSLLSHFESRADYPGSSCTYDIDDDGDQDLFIGAVGNVEFYRNVGSPATPHWRTESLALLPVPDGFFQAGRSLYPQVCDIDADGDGDMLITGEYANNRIVLFENAGTPSSPDWPVDSMIDNWQGISVPHNLHICFGDLDGDGDLDMVSSNRVGDASGTVTSLDYRQNVGTATTAAFAAPVSLQAVPSYPPSFDGYHYEDCVPSLADLDADGDLDLLAAAVMSTQFRSASWINLFENTGTATAPTFAASPDVLNILPFALREAGYVLTSDLNGDGQADVLCGDSDGGLRYFQQASASLSIGPAGATVPSGQALSLATPSATGTVSWSLIRNASGATINPSTGLYTAGASTEVVDSVRARDDRGTPGDLSDDLIGQAHIHVISPASIAQAGRAIIVAGTRSADTLWPATDFLAQTAYQALLARGFTRDTITLLTQTANQDIDGDGLNDSDGLATLATLQSAIEGLPPGTNRLFVYLVDHGGDTAGSGYVRLNPTETVTGSQLDAWLDALQTAQGTDVSAVIDCCRSGSFLDEMIAPSGQDRVVIASTLESEDAFFTAGGHVSFSDALLGAIEGGLTLGEAFDLAQGAMDRYQRAQMDDNGDGLYDRDGDGALARAWEVGASFTAGSDRPQIGLISANQTLSGGVSTALVWADDVTGASAVDRVWAVVVSPEFQPNPDDLAEFPIEEQLTQRELTYDPVDERYEVTLTGLTSLGAYKVILYARDVWGGVSFPKQTYINQTESTEELILLASDQAYDANSPAAWSSQVIAYAYEVALARLFPPANVTVLDASGNGILEPQDSPPTEAALLAAISGANGASQLTIQLVGPGSVDAFQINASDTLTASEL